MLYRTLFLTLILFFFNLKSNADNCIPNPNGAAYNVTSIADSGPGSIRQVILDANAAQVGGTISINLVTINLLSPLPSITVDSLIITGNWVDFNHSVTEPVFTFTTQHSCVSVDAKISNVNQGTFTVTNTNDTGAGSLRDAINKSNCSFSNDNILFNIPGTAPHVIPLVNALPLISNPISIMGSSQPANGYSGNAPKIMLDGSFALTPVNGLNVYYNINLGSLIRTINISGLSIQNCVVGIDMGYTTGNIGNSSSKNIISNCGTGLRIVKSTGITIRNNYFGVDSSGTIAHPDNIGISLEYDTNTTVTDNLISGNVYGLVASTGKDITVSGNMVGTDASGMLAIPNTINGIELYANSGISQINSNLISGNRNSSGNCIGLDILYNNLVQINSNKIGTNITGTDTIGNDFGLYAPATKFTASNNLISGNTNGIYAFGFSATISNNKIGTNYSGYSALPNKYGIWMELDQQDTVTITDNLISGNEYGINGNNSDGYCEIKRNYFGLDNSHVNVLPNGAGIAVLNTCQGRLIIGGANSLDGNYICGSLYNGIVVGGSCPPSSTIIRNNKIGITPTGGSVGNNTGIYTWSNNNKVQDNIIKNNTEGIKIGSQVVQTEIGNNTVQDNQTGILVHGNQSYIHHNVISNNLQDGIYVYGVKNTISRNQIYDNGLKGINIVGTGNNLIAPPITIHADPTLVNGTSLPNSRIELYYSQSQNQNPQGKTLIDSVNSDASGNWTYTGSINSPCNVTVTQTDSAGNTSEFSFMEASTSAGIDSTICMNTSLTLYALPLQTGQTGQWSSQNGLSFGNITNPHSMASGFTTQTTYTLIWSVNYGSCTNSDTVMILADPCLGMNETESDLVKVYPNPAEDKIYIETNEEMKGASFEMWQLEGKVVLNGIIKNPLSAIDVSKFSKGIYVYKIVNDKGVFVQRILLK